MTSLFFWVSLFVCQNNYEQNLSRLVNGLSVMCKGSVIKFWWKSGLVDDLDYPWLFAILGDKA